MGYTEAAAGSALKACWCSAPLWVQGALSSTQRQHSSALERHDSMSNVQLDRQALLYREAQDRLREQTEVGVILSKALPWSAYIRSYAWLLVVVAAM